MDWSHYNLLSSHVKILSEKMIGSSKTGSDSYDEL